MNAIINLRSELINSLIAKNSGATSDIIKCQCGIFVNGLLKQSLKSIYKNK